MYSFPGGLTTRVLFGEDDLELVLYSLEVSHLFYRSKILFGSSGMTGNHTF